MNLSKSNLIQIGACAAVLSALFLVPELANATGTGLQGMAEKATGSIGALAKLFMAVSYLAGIGFVLAGMLGFKAHKENAQQYPLSKAIVLVAVGAGLVFLPSIITIGGDSLGMKEKGDSTGSKAS